MSTMKCPWCGGENLYPMTQEVGTINDEDGFDTLYMGWVFCENCIASGPVVEAKTQAEALRMAVEAWNAVPRSFWAHEIVRKLIRGDGA